MSSLVFFKWDVIEVAVIEISLHKKSDRKTMKKIMTILYLSFGLPLMILILFDVWVTNHISSKRKQNHGLDLRDYRSPYKDEGGK